uniref:doublecortin domain-containing protein 2-like n=1 Tax=Pristiophorus japonicus TaxID=55135 RepID=UPI00398F3BB1
MATTKPNFLAQPAVKSVRVYRNGDPFYAGRKFVINERQISTFEAFLKEVTSGLEAPFGAVRNIYTPQQGHRVYQLEELGTGKQYVAGGKERFKKLDYIQIGIKKKKPLPKDIQIKPVAHSRIIASARFKKPTREPCTICVIANGDLLNPAIRLLIPKRTLGQWEQILSSVTEKVNLRTGAVRKLHTLDGRSINDGTELENGGCYVAVGRDKFKKLPYSEPIFSKPCPRRSNGSKAASLPPIPGSQKSKENGDRQVRSTGTTSEVYPLTSPQPPKRKGKKKPVPAGEEFAFSAKPIKVNHIKNGTGSPKISQDTGCVFKAYEERTETMGAIEVQEDYQTQVELPIDQRPAETVDEEVNTEELCKEESSHEGDGDFQNVEREICNNVFYKEEILTIRHVEEDLPQHDLAHKEEKTGEESESDHQVEEEIADPADDEESDTDEMERSHEDKYFDQHGLPKTGEEGEIDHQVEEEIPDPAEEEEEDTDQTEKSHEDKYFHQHDLSNKKEKTGKESEIDHQVEEEILDPAEEEEEDTIQTEKSHKDKYFHRIEDDFQKEDLHQESEDSSAEEETPLEEIEKENEMIPTEKHSKDDDNLEETVTSPAENIHSPLETDGKETIQSATGHAVLAQ